MTKRLSIVGVSGSVTRPSKTTALVSEILSRLAAELAARSQLIELIDVAPDLLAALTPDQLTERGRQILDAIERADLLVVATPVYRASMTGALKHVFDLADQRAFVGKPIVLAATGGSAMHGLMTEHQMRPLFGFLNALTLPTTIYALEADFENYRVASATIHDRIDRIIGEATKQLSLYDRFLRRTPAEAAA